MSAARTAVVTGGASGIGRAIAQRLTADGFNVSVFDLNPADEGHSLVVDVTDRAQVDKAMDAVREHYGPVSVLVNAAGRDGFIRFADLSFADWQRVVDINLNGVFHCVQSALPDMRAGRWGRIVNISSSSTHSGQPFMAHYVAAKSAVNGLTKSLALELGPQGVTVNAIPPGFIDTPMLRTAEQAKRLGGTVEDHIARTPVRRVGLPEDIAATCSFLVSEEAGYITGQIIGVNGGRNT
ncbi:SDR family NAD(P)-dependent oxidoreductase [Streptomyces sp. NBC_01358]|uniref:SDR family NAD(P)-dependent oxidoreductase n=1 Tax=Streptomyces sp. NBC_01358 TaxID=2903837 RepID=UPI002E2F32BA|nr:SDR family NAD(P)-dependent oxidoreductase [Streptomyces sp. NBC_01358]